MCAELVRYRLDEMEHVVQLAKTVLTNKEKGTHGCLGLQVKTAPPPPTSEHAEYCIYTSTSKGIVYR